MHLGQEGQYFIVMNFGTNNQGLSSKDDIFILLVYHKRSSINHVDNLGRGGEPNVHIIS